MSRRSVAPIEREAVMKSRLRRLSTSARTSRATLSQLTAAMITASERALGLSRIESMMNRNMAGMARSVSTNRIRTSSATPL
jgi:hypothetical protein